MMKNGVFFTILLLLAVSSFAQDIRNRYLYIEGTAGRTDHVDFFKSNFAMEANGAGYVVTQSRSEALHTLKFNITSDTSDPDYEQYSVNISLYRNQDDAQLISFSFMYSSIDEMYTFTRTLFLNATAGIPLPIMTEEGTQWEKWIYFRASFDYPITFYLLQPREDLVAGRGLYNPDPANPSDPSKALAVDPIGHEIMAMPGATVGVEFQRFSFLSLEANFQMSMGDTRNMYFVNTAVGLELKFPIKFQNIMLVPYGAFVYTFHISPIFNDFPPYAAGGGVQLCTRAGKRGAFFADVKYVFSFQGDAVMRNPYLDVEDQLYPKPAEIHYRRSHLGIGVGYKVGIIDRKRR
jgi:hypothetical protein